MQLGRVSKLSLKPKLSGLTAQDWGATQWSMLYDVPDVNAKVKSTFQLWPFGKFICRTNGNGP